MSIHHHRRGFFPPKKAMNDAHGEETLWLRPSSSIFTLSHWTKERTLQQPNWMGSSCLHFVFDICEGAGAQKWCTAVIRYVVISSICWAFTSCKWMGRQWQKQTSRPVDVKAGNPGPVVGHCRSGSITSHVHCLYLSPFGADKPSGILNTSPAKS